MRREPGFVRDLVELILGYGLIVGVIWIPESLQHICTPVVFVFTLAVVLARLPSPGELGIGFLGLISSLWIFPAAAGLALVSVAVAKHFGTLHALYKGDLKHVTGYVLWTLYQQFLLNDYFMPRLERVLGSASLAVGLAGILFAAAHLPNPVLTIATLVWGLVSCALYLRYRNLYMLGLAQGLLGLCIAVCVPDALHHHLRVGLGYLRYGAAAGK